MSKKGGHVKPWHVKNRKKYDEVQQWNNVLELAKALKAGLPIAQLKDITRRDRPDPRLVSEGTPLCVADWCWRMNSAGIRMACGLDQGSVKRLVVANDAGYSAKTLAVKLMEEALRNRKKRRR